MINLLVCSYKKSYEMVERLIEQMETIRVVLASDRKTSHLIPSWQDCDVLDSLSAALKPLKEMTDALSGERCVTVSAIKPLLSHLTSEVLVDKQGDTRLLHLPHTIILSARLHPRGMEPGRRELVRDIEKRGVRGQEVERAGGWDNGVRYCTWACP